VGKAGSCHSLTRTATKPWHNRRARRRYYQPPTVPLTAEGMTGNAAAPLWHVLVPFLSIIGSSIGLGFGNATKQHWGLAVAMGGACLVAPACVPQVTLASAFWYRLSSSPSHPPNQPTNQPGNASLVADRHHLRVAAPPLGLPPRQASGPPLPLLAGRRRPQHHLPDRCAAVSAAAAWSVGAVVYRTLQTATNYL
jgi:hypothetical protein